MRNKAPPKRAREKQKRLSPDDRRREFVAKAAEFFAEQGFGGGAIRWMLSWPVSKGCLQPLKPAGARG